MNKRSNKGISLIALIITIIVIIILAAIVIGGVFNTPNDAKFANFCQEYDRVQTAIQLKYYELYQKYAISVSTEVPTHYEMYNEVATGTKADTLTGANNIDSDKWVTISESQWGIGSNKICAKPSFAGNWYVRLNDGKLAYAGFEKGEQDMYYTPTAHTTGNRTAQAVDYFNGLTLGTAADSETQSGLLALVLGEGGGSSNGSGDGGAETLPELEEGEAYLAQVAKVGDYVKYVADSGTWTPDPTKTGNSNATPLRTDTSTAWRVWENNGTTVTLIPTSPVNTLYLGTRASTSNTSSPAPTDDTGATYGVAGYVNGPSLMNEIARTLYSKSGYTSSVRHMTYEDIQAKLKTPFTPTANKYAYFKSGDSSTLSAGSAYMKRTHTTSLYNGITEPRFYTWDTDGVTYDTDPTSETYQVRTDSNGRTYMTPTTGHPVYVTYTYIKSSIAADNWADVTDTHATGTTTYGNILGGSYSWLASPCVYLSTGGAHFYMRIVASDYLNGNSLAGSHGESASRSNSLRPLVTLSSSVRVNTTDSAKNGSTTANAWIIK
ncbi:MAG: hypothetical protein IJ217_02795 [Clostridia bacterium]|nr:hypothetical protein [Clostridia bacterium]